MSDLGPRDPKTRGFYGARRRYPCHICGRDTYTYARTNADGGEDRVCGECLDIEIALAAEQALQRPDPPHRQPGADGDPG